MTKYSIGVTRSLSSEIIGEPLSRDELRWSESSELKFNSGVLKSVDRVGDPSGVGVSTLVSSALCTTEPW